MRLINTRTYEMHSNGDDAVRENPQYAILSHRWKGAEISYKQYSVENLRNPSLQTPYLDKIRKACVVARKRETPLEWLWIDTCCIDKTNAVEESTSINSMFEWYRRAAVCIAFLFDVDERLTGPQIFDSQLPARRGKKSEWFERGWTLQELLAPRHMEFFGQSWDFMGTKHDLQDALHSITRINKAFLYGNFEMASVATRLSWMAGRTTTVVEDVAYSLLGIFGIHMTPQYGEGVQAFMRLQRTLIQTSTDESIFAWTIPTQGLNCYQSLGPDLRWSPQNWGLLAPSPDCFADSSEIFVNPHMVVPRPPGGYQWTQQGVQFQTPMKANTDVLNFLGLARSDVKFTLNCWKYDANNKALTVQLDLALYGHTYCRANCDRLRFKKGAKPSTNSVMGIDQLITKPIMIMQPDFRL